MLLFFSIAKGVSALGFAFKNWYVRSETAASARIKQHAKSVSKIPIYG